HAAGAQGDPAASPASRTAASPPAPPKGHVRDQQHAEQDRFLHLVRHPYQPAARDPPGIGIEWHLLEAHRIVHEKMDGVKEKWDGGPEPEAERRDPEESDGLLQR